MAAARRKRRLLPFWSAVLVHDVFVGGDVEHLLPGGKFRAFPDPGIHLLLGQGLEIALAFNAKSAALQEFLEGAEFRIAAHEGGVEDLVEVHEFRRGLVRKLIVTGDFD